MIEDGTEVPDPRLRKLFPNLSDEELKQAGEHFEDYINVVLRVAEEIDNDPERGARSSRNYLKRGLAT